MKKEMQKSKTRSIVGMLPITFLLAFWLVFCTPLVNVIFFTAISLAKLHMTYVYPTVYISVSMFLSFYVLFYTKVYSIAFNQREEKQLHLFFTSYFISFACLLFWLVFSALSHIKMYEFSILFSIVSFLLLIIQIGFWPLFANGIVFANEKREIAGFYFYSNLMVHRRILKENVK